MGNIRLMKQETTLRHFAIIALLGITFASAPVLATAATSKPATPKVATVICKATKAVAHTAKKVTTPTKMLPKRMGTFTFVTNCGNIVITTNGVRANVTLTALTALAKAGYFDGSLCHRLTTSDLFILQCGDPTATGSGPSPFTYGDENLPAKVANNYPVGTVAMANSGANTNGSQFFLVYANTTLGPSYTIWGRITSGLNIVKAIAAAGVKGGIPDGTPVKKIAIEKVIVK
jgi:peptidyl-prolyl cis-trans isomerase B (cyclophilin B)